MCLYMIYLFLTSFVDEWKLQVTLKHYYNFLWEKGGRI